MNLCAYHHVTLVDALAKAGLEAVMTTEPDPGLRRMVKLLDSGEITPANFDAFLLAESELMMNVIKVTGGRIFNEDRDGELCLLCWVDDDHKRNCTDDCEDVISEQWIDRCAGSMARLWESVKADETGR